MGESEHFCSRTNRCAVAMTDVEQRSPDHADAGMVINVEKGQLLALLATKDD